MSINILIDTRDVCARPGTMWAACTSFGNKGLSNSHSWVDSSMPPSSWLIQIGLVAGCMLLAGAHGCRKWPYAPASAIPKSLLMLIGLLACKSLSLVFVKLLMATVMLSLSSLLANNLY